MGPREYLSSGSCLMNWSRACAAPPGPGKDRLCSYMLNDRGGTDFPMWFVVFFFFFLPLLFQPFFSQVKTGQEYLG